MGVSFGPEVVVGLLLRGLGWDLHQIRARIGNPDFADGALEHVDLHVCVLWSEVAVGLLLRGLGWDFHQIRARIGNPDFAAGVLEHVNLHLCLRRWNG